MRIPNPIHMEFTGDASASGGVAVKVFRSGTTVDISAQIIGTKRIVITDITLVSVAGGAVGIWAATNADGKRVFKGTIVANGGIVKQFRTEFFCPAATIPKVEGPGSLTDVQMEGYIADE